MLQPQPPQCTNLQHAAVARVELALAAQQAGHEEVKQAPQLLHICKSSQAGEQGTAGITLLGGWTTQADTEHLDGPVAPTTPRSVPTTLCQ